ncbi:hypothetical protein AGMMS49975_28760 [Clostridia bacterium]|nr:hypothetical protein AGMMS49975_28760 [Clostridia bacterium]
MSKKATTALQTLIEEILKVEDSRVSAKALYEFLELDLTHYTRWSKTQILENAFAEEGIDFISFAIEGERKGGEKYQPNPTTNYLLSVQFAKKLCMLSKSDKGEQARNYFIKCEAVLNTILDSPKVAATVPAPVAPAQLPASKPPSLCPAAVKKR